MKHRLRMTAAVEQLLRSHHLSEGKHVEAISLVFGHAHTGPDGSVTVVLADVDGVLLFDDDCYEGKSFAHAALRKDVRAAACWDAVKRGFSAIVDVHDHHFAAAAHFSGVDDADDQRTALYFSKTLPAFLPPGKAMLAAALLLSQGDWAARLVHGGQAAAPLETMRVDVVGLVDRQLSAERHAATAPEFDRQRAVVPAMVQARLCGLNAAIVGVGGTGSIMAESLSRLGFGHLSLIDPDLLDHTNLHRFQGGRPADVGRPKVNCVAERLQAMCPQTAVTPIAAEAFASAARNVLEAADIVIGCVDNAETRWWLNRFAMQWLVPYFDCGVLIEAGENTAPVFHTRVHVVLPGVGPCGHCTPLEFFPRQKPNRFLDAATLAEQRAEGYLLHTDAMVADPSLYALNQQAVSWLTQELMAWLTAGWPVAHTVNYRNDRSVIERLPLVSFGGGGADDCPLCSHLIGRCNSVLVPTEASDRLSLFNFNSTGVHDGQIQT